MTVTLNTSRKTLTVTNIASRKGMQKPTASRATREGSQWLVLAEWLKRKEKQGTGSVLASPGVVTRPAWGGPPKLLKAIGQESKSEKQKPWMYAKGPRPSILA